MPASESAAMIAGLRRQRPAGEYQAVVGGFSGEGVVGTRQHAGQRTAAPWGVQPMPLRLCFDGKQGTLTDGTPPPGIGRICAPALPT